MCVKSTMTHQKIFSRSLFLLTTQNVKLSRSENHLLKKFFVDLIILDPFFKPKSVRNFSAHAQF